MGPKLRTTLSTACFSVGWPNMAGWAGLASGWAPRDVGGREPKRRGGLFALRKCTSGHWPTLHTPGSDLKAALPLCLTGTNVKGDLSPNMGEAPGSSWRRSFHFSSCRITGIRLCRTKDPALKEEDTALQPFTPRLAAEKGAQALIAGKGLASSPGWPAACPQLCSCHLPGRGRDGAAWTEERMKNSADHTYGLCWDGSLQRNFSFHLL